MSKIFVLAKKRLNNGYPSFVNIISSFNKDDLIDLKNKLEEELGLFFNEYEIEKVKFFNNNNNNIKNFYLIKESLLNKHSFLKKYLKDISSVDNNISLEILSIPFLGVYNG